MTPTLEDVYNDVAARWSGDLMRDLAEANIPYPGVDGTTADVIRFAAEWAEASSRKARPTELPPTALAGSMGFALGLMVGVEWRRRAAAS
jgi:hypothetical protein